MNYYKILAAIVSISFFGFFVIHAIQFHEKNIKEKELVAFYSRELAEVYINGYGVDQNGKLILSQHSFEKSINELEEKLLLDGFNRAEISLMKDRGRKMGREARRLQGSIHVGSGK